MTNLNKVNLVVCNSTQSQEINTIYNSIIENSNQTGESDNSDNEGHSQPKANSNSNECRQS